MHKHTYHFMEVPSLMGFNSQILGLEDKPGFVAMCDDTGIIVATDEEDGWQSWPEASREPIYRIQFAISMHCCLDEDGEGIVHVLADQ